MARAPDRTLSHVPIFRGLTPDERERVEARCRWTAIGEQQTIVHHQDLSNDVYAIIDGRARVLIHSAAGRAVAYRDLAVGDIFGEYSAIDGRQRSASVVAIEACLVAVLSARDFRGLLERQPAVTLALLESAVAQIRGLTERVFEFSTLAVSNRIHAEILRLALAGEIDGNDARVIDPPTHFEIATRISTNREAVTRELKAMEAKGVIRRVGSQAIICDLVGLRRLVDEAAGA